MAASSDARRPAGSARQHGADCLWGPARASVRSRFSLRSARAASALNHPNILTVHAAGGDLLLGAERYVSPWALASIHVQLGDPGAALDWLERAFEERDSTLVWLKVHPRFDPLRGEPRFRTLAARLRLD